MAKTQRDEALKMARQAGVKVARGATTEQIQAAVKADAREKFPNLAAWGDSSSSTNND